MSVPRSSASPPSAPPQDTSAPSNADRVRSENESAPKVAVVEDDIALAPEEVIVSAQPEPHPLDGLSPEDIEQRLQEAPDSLGSMSIGSPNAGRLFGAVPMVEDDRWIVVDPAGAWGTQETVSYLVTAITRVFDAYPDSPRLQIGHISSKDGGHLRPHLSHQSGRDVDVGFFYLEGSRWYKRARADNLDLPRTWALVRALITLTDVRFILLDHGVQRLLRDHALKAGEDPAWIRDIFDGTKGKHPPLLRHAPGHGTHMHVRFYNPVAEETARRCFDALVKLNYIDPPKNYITHRVRKGETLSKLAKRYATTVKAIQRANGMRGTVIQAKRTYKIPAKGYARPRAVPRVPPRRLPPSKVGSARAASTKPD